jgi:hypothetical protein
MVLIVIVLWFSIVDLMQKSNTRHNIHTLSEAWFRKQSSRSMGIRYLNTSYRGGSYSSTFISYVEFIGIGFTLTAIITLRNQVRII